MNSLWHNDFLYIINGVVVSNITAPFIVLHGDYDVKVVAFDNASPHESSNGYVEMPTHAFSQDFSDDFCV